MDTASSAVVAEIPSSASREDIELYIVESRPFIMRSAIGGWRTDSWSDSNVLVGKVGAQTRVSVRENVSERGEWLGRPAEMAFVDFVEHWLKPECPDYSISQGSTRLPQYYLASLPISKNFPSLSEDIAIPPFAAEQGPKYGNLWMGNAGQVTALHYDYSSGEPGMDGFHYLLSGRKIFKLYDPIASLGCIPRRREWWRWHQAAFDPDGPDPPPQFRGAVPLVADLGPGDMLFIPKLWWHHVYTLSRAVAVNFWFQHLGSEALKLGRHWPMVEEHLAAAASMELDPARLVGVLAYHGIRGLSEAALARILAEPLLFVAVPTFADHVGNVAVSPFFDGEEKVRVGAELRSRVRAWIAARLPADTDPVVREILSLPIFSQSQ